MRKRQFHSFKPPQKLNKAPCLNSEQLMQFKQQFTLFDDEISLSKLKDAIHNKKSHIRSKPVFQFIEQLATKKTTITFQEYMRQMKQYLQLQNICNIIGQVLPQGRQINKSEIKELLQDSLGREVLPSQLREVMQKIFDNEEEKISGDKIQSILAYEISQQKQ